MYRYCNVVPRPPKESQLQVNRGYPRSSYIVVVVCYLSRGTCSSRVEVSFHAHPGPCSFSGRYNQRRNRSYAIVITVITPTRHSLRATSTSRHGYSRPPLGISSLVKTVIHYCVMIITVEILTQHRALFRQIILITPLKVLYTPMNTRVSCRKCK